MGLLSTSASVDAFRTPPVAAAPLAARGPSTAGEGALGGDGARPPQPRPEAPAVQPSRASVMARTGGERGGEATGEQSSAVQRVIVATGCSKPRRSVLKSPDRSAGALAAGTYDH